LLLVIRSKVQASTIKLNTSHSKLAKVQKTSICSEKYEIVIHIIGLG